MKMGENLQWKYGKMKDYSTLLFSQQIIELLCSFGLYINKLKMYKNTQREIC